MRRGRSSSELPLRPAPARRAGAGRSGERPHGQSPHALQTASQAMPLGGPPLAGYCCDRRIGFWSRRCAADFVAAGSHFVAELSQRQRRVLEAELGDLAQVWGELVEAPRLLETADRLELHVGGAARADEVRVVGVREAVRLGSRGADDRALLQGQRRVARARCREHARDPVDALRVGDRVVAAVRDAEVCALGRRGVGDRLRARAASLDLEVRRGRRAHRAGREERSAQVRGPAAGPAEHAPRRSLARRQPRVDDAALPEQVE